MHLADILLPADRSLSLGIEAGGHVDRLSLQTAGLVG